MRRCSMWTGLALLLLVAVAAQATAAQQPTAEQDTIFWESIRDSSALEEFEAYLELFPEGAFRVLAEIRLRRLRAVRAGLNPEETCVGKAEGAACWQAIAGQPGCYIWNPGLQPGSSVSWSGECGRGLAQGRGTFEWTWGDESSETGTGFLVDAKTEGHWVIRVSPSGRVYEGSFADGEQVGTWIIREPDGTHREVDLGNGVR